MSCLTTLPYIVKTWLASKGDEKEQEQEKEEQGTYWLRGTEA